MNKLIVAQITSIVLIGLLLMGCHASEKNKWTPPKFVKEWEIKEIKPGLKPEIISMTVNKNGIFVLAKVVYSKSVSLERMTKEERIVFANRFISDKIIPATAFQKLTEKEKEEIIKFVEMNFMPPNKSNQSTAEEKEKIFSKFIQIREDFAKKESKNYPYYKNNTEGIKESVKDRGVDSFFRSITAEYPLVFEVTDSFCLIQQYDFEGNFIGQWPDGNKLKLSDNIRKKLDPLIVSRHRPHTDTLEIDSRDYLINPSYIVSDDLNNIYIADYDGNKIVKFDLQGGVLNLWWIKKAKELKWISENIKWHKGLSVANDKLYILYEESAGSGPKISEYDLDGKLLREKSFKPLKVPARAEISGKTVPFLKTETNVSALSVDKEGNLYMLAGDTRVFIFDNKWNEKGYIKTVLEEGFEKPKPVYDPDRKREIKYDELTLGEIKENFNQFSSDKISWIENGPGLYYANGMHFSPKEELYVSFIGGKPFGVIDAMIFNKKGNMLGYWKQDKKSYSEWFDKLTDIQQLMTKDAESFEIGFYGENIFIGRNLVVWSGAETGHSVIQKFTLGEPK